MIEAYRAKLGRQVDRYFAKLPDPADHPVFLIDVEDDPPSGALAQVGVPAADTSLVGTRVLVIVVLIAMVAAALNLLVTRADASAPWSAGGAPAHAQVVGPDGSRRRSSRRSPAA